MTDVKSRHEIILELGSKLWDVINETNLKTNENISLFEVVIACGIEQIALYEEAFRRKNEPNREG